VGGGRGVGEKPNHTTARKPGSLYITQYSLGDMGVQMEGGSMWGGGRIQMVEKSSLVGMEVQMLGCS
jgi:hypothetical protein